jgi:cystinosin
MCLVLQEVVFFDVIFIIQHYVLYPVKRDENGKAIISERVAPLIRPLDKPEEDSV